MNLNSSAVRKVSIGDKVRLPVRMDKGTVTMEGTVIYIHPKGRFFRVEFETESGCLRESYAFAGPIDT